MSKVKKLHEDQPATAIKTGGGISDQKLRKYAGSMKDLKSQMDEIRGELGAETKQFEEDGGNKAAMKLALKLSSMETQKAQDFWRSLEAYMTTLGIFDQHDLFDSVPGQAAMPPAPQPMAMQSATHH